MQSVTRDPGAVHCAPDCGTRSAQDAVYLADGSLNHGSEWTEPALAADDAVDQFVCHLRHLLWWNRVEGGGSPMTHRSTQPARHIKRSNGNAAARARPAPSGCTLTQVGKDSPL